jgi:hypothetical protein
MVRDAQDALLTMRDSELSSSHLALRLGGVFGIEFAGHAVAAVWASVSLTILLSDAL